MIESSGIKLPDHNTFVVPFGRSPIIFLEKERSKVEVYNDLDSRASKLFEVLRDRQQEFADLFNKCCGTPEVFAVTEVLAKWHVEFKNTNIQLDNKPDWLSAICPLLPDLIERLRSVQLMNRTPIDIIKRFDSPDTLFYCRSIRLNVEEETALANVKGQTVL